MIETSGSILGVVQEQVYSARRAVFSVASLVGLLSGFGGFLVLVVHSITIGYLPDADIADIATLLGVVLLIGLWLAISFLMLGLAPAVLMYIGQKPRNAALQVDSNVRNSDTKKIDEPGIKVGVLFLLDAIFVFIGILIYFHYGDRELWWSLGAILIIPILAVPMEVCCEKWKPKWVEDTAPRLERYGFLVFSLLVQTGSSVLIVLTALKTSSNNIPGQLTFVGVVIFVAAVINWCLIAILRNVPIQDGFAIKFVGGIALIVFIFFGTALVNVSLKAVGLADVHNVSLAIDNHLYPQAAKSGFKCLGANVAHRSKDQNEVCVIQADLVTRIGKHYVLKRSSSNVAIEGDRSNKYFIVPKDRAIWIPTS
jgi:hypothetical protein